ncbi:hypothetical protein LSM04_006529 [Trypanosoma melophagium]|uniref:uncharacterized protein n=1 Tax=Trypanosoma melophagium TaxID=715481 RepID=UPI00351A6CBC|nr:hypothetical protein LSM04_006529 [Trypanosoma melophagium]
MVYCGACGALFDHPQSLSIHQQLYCSGGNLVNGIRPSPQSALPPSLPVMPAGLSAVSCMYPSPHNNMNNGYSVYPPQPQAISYSPPYTYNMCDPTMANNPVISAPAVRAPPAQMANMIQETSPLTLPAKEMYQCDKIAQTMMNAVLAHQEGTNKTLREVDRLRMELQSMKILPSQERQIPEVEGLPQSNGEKQQQQQQQYPQEQRLQQKQKVFSVERSRDRQQGPAIFVSPKKTEVKENSTSMNAPFPTSSLLDAKKYTLLVEHVEGIDIQVPLTDVVLTIEQYRLFAGEEVCSLESLALKQYRNVDMRRKGVATFLIILDDPMEFTLKKANDLHVFIITFSFKGRPLFWASVNARQEGMWMSVLRSIPVDVSSAMQMNSSCMQDSMIRGTIACHPDDDVLMEAERYLNSNPFVSVVPIDPLTTQTSKISTTTTPKKESPSSVERHSSPEKNDSTNQKQQPSVSEEKGSPSKPSESPPSSKSEKVPSQETAAYVPKDMKAVEKSILRINFDAKGNVIVPVDYKPGVHKNKKFSDQDEELYVDASTIFGLHSETDIPPFMGEASNNVTTDEVNFSITAITGIPLDAAFTRVLVYILEYKDIQSGETVNLANDPALFMKPPNVVQYQDINDSTTCPNFSIDMTGIPVTKTTFAVAIIEYITASSGGPYVFGHVGLPIHSGLVRGKFISRVRLGDPRRPEARKIKGGGDLPSEREAMRNYSQIMIEETIDSQALYNKLFTPPSGRAECCPCGFIMWCLDGDKGGACFDAPYQPKPSKGEHHLFSSRFGKDLHTTPCFSSLEAAKKRFEGAPKPMGNRINYIVPYEENRGFFVAIESLHGLGNECALYAVAVDLGWDGPDGIAHTSHRDWSSDVGAPRFSDPMHVLTGITEDPSAFALFYLIRITKLHTISKHGAAQLKAETASWSLLRLFSKDGVLRHGHYAIPWFPGEPPDELLEELESEPMENVILSRFKKGTLRHTEQRSTLVLSVGDPIDAEQLLVNHPGRPLPQRLLITESQRDTFPCLEYEGAIGYSQQQLVQDLGLSTSEVEAAVNSCVKAYVSAKIEK